MPSWLEAQRLLKIICYGNEGCIWVLVFENKILKNTTTEQKISYVTPKKFTQLIQKTQVLIFTRCNEKLCSLCSSLNVLEDNYIKKDENTSTVHVTCMGETGNAYKIMLELLH